MRRIMRSIAAILVLALSGCVSVTAVNPGMPTAVGDFTVDPQVQWANLRIGLSNEPVWTIDGFGLQEIRFYTGVQPGRPLFPIPGANQADLPVYQANMLPNDVMDFIAAALGRVGYLQVRTAALTPAPFGSAMGFRFDLTMTTAAGLQMKGSALAAQRNGHLDVILYLAAAEHYYDRYAPVVDRIFASVRTV